PLARTTCGPTGNAGNETAVRRSEIRSAPAIGGESGASSVTDQSFARLRTPPRTGSPAAVCAANTGATGPSAGANDRAARHNPSMVHSHSRRGRGRLSIPVLFWYANPTPDDPPPVSH